MPRSFDYTVVLEPQPEGGFTVHVPALPEVVTEGDTEAEALAMAREAIRMAVEYRLENGIEIAADMTPKLRTVTIAA
jgi:antitoxin HicB